MESDRRRAAAGEAGAADFAKRETWLNTPPRRGAGRRARVVGSPRCAAPASPAAAWRPP